MIRFFKRLWAGQQHGPVHVDPAPIRANNNNLDTTVTFNLEGFDEGHHKVTYKGVSCVKAPFDYVIYQMIIEEVKPDLIVEIGSHVGGSALYLADLLELHGKGELHTIDIKDIIDQRVKANKRIKFFFNGWENYDLTLAANFESVLVIEDGSHKYEDTLNAMRKFSKIVSIGSYLIVEDGIIEELGLSNEYHGGPIKAIKKFIKNNSNFEIANNWSDLFGKNATFNTIGYLKRIS